MVELLDRWIEKESLVKQYLFVDKMQGKRAGGSTGNALRRRQEEDEVQQPLYVLANSPTKKITFICNFLCAIAEKSCWSQDGDGSLGGRISHP